MIPVPDMLLFVGSSVGFSVCFVFSSHMVVLNILIAGSTVL